MAPFNSGERFRAIIALLLPIYPSSVPLPLFHYRRTRGPMRKTMSQTLLWLLRWPDMTCTDTIIVIFMYRCSQGWTNLKNKRELLDPAAGNVTQKSNWSVRKCIPIEICMNLICMHLILMTVKSNRRFHSYSTVPPQAFEPSTIKRDLKLHSSSVILDA